jgi:hypothetical protein
MRHMIKKENGKIGYGHVMDEVAEQVEVCR